MFKKIKIKYNNLSIKWKIFTFLIAFCAMLLIILWLFQIVFLDNFYRYIKTNEVKKAAKSIVSNIDNDNLSNMIENIGTSNEVCIEVLSDSLTTLYSYDALKDCLIHRMSITDKLELCIKTLRNDGELLQYPETLKNSGMNRPGFFHDDKQSIIYSTVFLNSAGERRILFINSVISPVSATVKTITIQFYIIASIMLVFAVLIAFLISKKVSKPIENINKSAKILAKGNYDTVFSGTGYKEINELTKTLNYAADELSKVDSLKNELIANVSHDLRTPLTLISGYAEVMRDIPLENNSENAQIIIDEAKRLTTLVNDILDISKIQSGNQAMNFENFCITSEIQKVIDTTNVLIKNNGYIINFEYDENINVFADRIKISQAFYNLLSNAINYTGDDKTVIVKQINKDDCVRIEVCDSGDGIEEENLANIWDRYFKIDKTHKRAVAGTGLGLSIVKSIIESHNGKYGIISEKGTGSTFWFEIYTKQIL